MLLICVVTSFNETMAGMGTTHSNELDILKEINCKRKKENDTQKTHM